MHSTSIGCPKIFPLSASVFALVIASDMHLESESEKRAKNERKTMIFTQQKEIYPDTANTFSLFLNDFFIFYKMTSDLCLNFP